MPGLLRIACFCPFRRLFPKIGTKICIFHNHTVIAKS